MPQPHQRAGRASRSIRHQVELAEMLLHAAMRSSAPSQLDGMTKLLEHIKSLNFESVDQRMGLMGDVEHCRAWLHEIIAASRGQDASSPGLISVDASRTHKC